MAAREDAPELVIRLWLDQHGSVVIGQGALAQTWHLERLDDDDRRRIAAALGQAGVVVDPPLETAGPGARFELSVARDERGFTEGLPSAEDERPAPAEETREREPTKLEAESGPATPDAPRAAESYPPRPTRRSRRAPLGRFRHLRPGARPAPPPPPPLRPVLPPADRPESPTLPAPGPPTPEPAAEAEAAVQPEPEAAVAAEPARPEVEPEPEPDMPPGIEPDYQPPPEPEVAPAPEPPPAPDLPPAPEPPTTPDLPPAPEPPPAPDPSETQTEEERYAASAAEARRRRAQAGRRDRPVALPLVGLAVAFMVVGSLGPWSESLTVVDHGIDRAGYVVIVAAALGGLMLIGHVRSGGRSALPLLAALVGTAAVAVLASDFRELVDDTFTSPAWGLYVAFAGSVALVALAMSLLARR